MKLKKFCALFLSATLFLSTVAIAAAAEKSAVLNGTSYRLHEKESGTHPYSEEGLKPILMDNALGKPYASSYGTAVAMWVWDYIDREGNIVDLNRIQYEPRFAPLYEFHDGLAAVVDPITYGVGYINASGELVIPCVFGLYFDEDWNSITGYFKDGVAPVFKEVYTRGNDEPAVSSIQVGMIDKTGTLIQPYQTMSVAEAAKSIHALDEYGNSWGEVSTPEQDYEIWIDGRLYQVSNGVITEKVSEWAKDGIELARKVGLVTEHTMTDMTLGTTRFQFAELIVNMVEKATGKTIEIAPDITFTDCKETAVLKAKMAGIVSGVGDNKFEPDTTTNREQIASMIYRAIIYIEQITGKEFTTKNSDLTKFTDKESVSSWASEGVGILANNGIMKGTSDTTLSPINTCSVEQSILLIYRVFNLTK